MRSGQTVYRYRNVNQATRHYHRLEEYYFTINSRETRSIISDENNIASSTAKQWNFGCVDTSFSPAPEFGELSTICQYLAQYDEFLVYAPIKIQVDNQVMILMDDVYDFVEAIDQKITQYIKESK